MSYSVKEIFYTLQGEGSHAGRPAVFCRFAGCNLWSGREVDRSEAACTFCDTDFVGTDGERGGKYSSDELAGIIDSLWPLGVFPHHQYRLTQGRRLLLDATGVGENQIRPAHQENEWEVVQRLQQVDVVNTTQQLLNRLAHLRI